MPTKNEIIDYLKEYKEKNKDRFFIEKLGLFGSFARGVNNLKIVI